MKLVRSEPESDALRDWLDARASELLVTSVLSEVELVRAVRRIEPDLVGPAGALLEHLAQHEIDARVRARAAAFLDPGFRSLDAVHLATADLLGDREPTVLVTYDRRLLGAARATQVAAASPGAEENGADRSQ